MNKISIFWRILLNFSKKVSVFKSINYSLYNILKESEKISEKLRDMILFHSYNNDILNTYINKIVSEDKLDKINKESY